MSPCFEVEITGTGDPDEVDLRVSASNGRFSARVDLWESRGALARLADEFRGFPASSSDHREASWGWASTPNGDGIRMTLSVAGTVPQLRIEAHSRSAETADFTCAVEASAIDSFVRVLEVMPLERGSVARLQLSA